MRRFFLLAVLGCFGALAVQANAPYISYAPIDGNNIEVEVYPNPFNDQFSVELKNVDRAEVTIVNLIGETLYQETLFGKNTKHNIQLEGVPNGIYFLNLSTSDESITKKIVKK